MLPKRIQADLDAANAAQVEYIAGRNETTVQAVRSASELIAPQPEAIAPVPLVADPIQPAPQPAPPAPPQDDKAEQRWKTLQGMVKGDLRETKQQIADLAALVTQLKERPAATPVVEPMTEQDKETFGNDLVAMVQRRVDARFAQVEERLATLESKVGVVASQSEITRKQQYFNELTRLVPNWRETNADERWLAWLNAVDEVFGVDRQAALNKAQAELDAPRTAKVFNSFTDSLPKPQPTATRPLASLVQPSTVGAAPTPSAPAVLKTVSKKVIDDFYLAVIRGAYAGKEAEKNAIENEINLAVAQGRVTG